MKYGIAVQHYGEHAVEMDGLNIGDPIQGMALELIYRRMGISDHDIVRIPFCDLKSYSGEYVILPMLGGVGFAPWYATMPLSPRIVPVFISVYVPYAELTQEMVSCLRTYAPVGCRDERTLNVMRKYHIPSFLSGCIAVVFPKRDTIPENGKVILVDTPESLEPYLPEEIRRNAERMSHILPLPKRAVTWEESEALFRRCRERLEYYRTKAALVVSSRMHALMPCMAMGIPVIGTFQNVSWRFAWMDKYIRLYSPADFSQIDWNPPESLSEDRKEWLLEFFCGQIQHARDRFSSVCAVSEFYETRERSHYGNHYENRVQQMHSYMPDTFRYLIWGCGLAGATTLEIMKREFPKAELAAGVDSFVCGEWQGVPIIKPDELERYPDAFILLATYSGRQECLHRMEELGRMENRDFLYVGTPNG